MPPTRSYFVNAPGTDYSLTPPPGLLAGVHGTAHFHVNAFGVRGQPFGADAAEYRILAVGGSTTRCTFLDETEAWTYLLEHQLGRTADGRSVWVGNVGKDAATSREHVLQVKYLLKQYPRIDAVVVLVGVNDMLSALQQGWQYRVPDAVTTPEAERVQMERAFVETPHRVQDEEFSSFAGVPWYKATAVWQLAHRAKQVLFTHRTYPIKDFPSHIAQSRRERQEAAEWVDSLPPLDAPLREYRRNLNAIADIAAASGATLVLVTQPTVWRAAMSVTEQQVLVFGYLGPIKRPMRVFYTVGSLERAMRRYNEALLAVCRERGLDCVDAAPRLARDTTTMYDDMHFNEEGARLLAGLLADHFRSRSPFHTRN
ncbi:MAG TPA: SGNH/GDSL hydrolase family protein [Gemmatimonadales bacterium]|nr:SGNH/GDSL hydrolase family protein [Gemmatimonadales bacterium]